MIKRLIFDVDGTLIQGVNFSNSIEKTLKKLNIYSNSNLNNFLDAISTYEQFYDNYNLTDYTKHMKNALNVDIQDEFLSIFFEELKTCVPPKNYNLIDCIYALSQEYELVLLTNFFAESQLNRLNNMGIGKYFTECYGEKKIKPYKEAYINACGKNKPRECVMIGDNVSLDILRAKQEGLNTIFVNSKNIEVLENIGMSVNLVENITNDIIKKFEI